MKEIIDLSQTLYDGMEVYPGDPEVKINQVRSLDKEGWRLRYLQFSSHAGTHADAFSHMDEDGETIDNIPIDRFIGKTLVVDSDKPFPKNVGLAFKEGQLTKNQLKKIMEANPLFVLVGNAVHFDVELERALLKGGILTITDLVNMDHLPSNKPFMFYGIPLKIKDGDGSPIRAFAVLE